MKVIEILTTTKNYIIKNIEHLIIMILVIIGMLLNIIWKEEKNETQFLPSQIEKEIIPEETEKVIEEKKIITVDIKGLVNKPGVYTFENDANINDLIKVAGGLKSGGTTSNINLSKKLTDQMVIIIYSTKELETKNVSTTLKCPSYDINECKDNNEKTSVIENENNNANSNSSKISINTATKEELMTLSGIGESKAIAIIEYRNTNGNFTKIEELMNVSGIGESSFAKIKDDITI